MSLSRISQSCFVFSVKHFKPAVRCVPLAWSPSVNQQAVMINMRSFSVQSKKFPEHEKIPENVWEKAEQTVNNAGEVLIRKAGQALGVTQTIAHDVYEHGQEKLHDVEKRTVEAAKIAGHIVSDKVHEAAHYTAVNVEKAAVYGAYKTGEVAGHAVKYGSEKVHEAAHYGAVKAEQAAVYGASKAGEAVGTVVHFGLEKAHEGVEQAKELGHKAMDAAKDTVAHAAHNVSDSAHQVYDHTKEVILEDVAAVKEAIVEKEKSFVDTVKGWFSSDEPKSSKK